MQSGPWWFLLELNLRAMRAEVRRVRMEWPEAYAIWSESTVTVGARTILRSITSRLVSSSSEIIVSDARAPHTMSVREFKCLKEVMVQDRWPSSRSQSRMLRCELEV